MAARIAPAALVVLLGACGSPQLSDLEPEEARDRLRRTNRPFTEDAFIERATAGDEADLRLYLAAGMDPDAGEGRALSTAAANGQLEIVEMLLEAGVDVDTGRGGVASPLFGAVMNGHLEAAALLLGAGADPNGRGGRAGTPALNLVKDETMAKLLIDGGANVNSRDGRGRTALFEAITLGDQGLEQLLLDSGADPELGDDAGRTPLLVATAYHFEVIKQQLFAAGVPPLPLVHLPAALLEEYSGRYEIEPIELVVHEDRGHLFIVERKTNGGIWESELVGLTETTFYRVGDPGVVIFRFERQEDGTVFALRRWRGPQQQLVPKSE